MVISSPGWSRRGGFRKIPTPAGVGIFRKPPRLLQPGDEITIEIDGVGSLTNPVVAG